jgi:hypothetical protein
MQVITLSEFGETRFLNLLKELDTANYAGDKRNNGWFSRLPEIYKTRFKEWFFLLDNDELIAFATIQEFYSGCYRLLTRTYIFPKYRRFTLPDNDTAKSPSTYLIEKQLEYVQGYKTVFISMQDLKRRKSIMRYRQKLGNQWKLHPNMLQTCGEINDKNCWQNVIYNGEEIALPSITIEDWKQKYD